MAYNRLGVRFKPLDEELCILLQRKVRGLELSHNEVVEMDVYSREPWLLGDHGKDSWSGEKYYFVKRETKSRSGKGVTPKRDIGGGWWKAGAAEEPIIVGDRIIGYKRQLKFLRYDKTRDRKNCIGTEWIMHEYKLPPKDKFQKWVLCRIKNKEKPQGATSEIGEKILAALNKLENQADNAIEAVHEIANNNIMMSSGDHLAGSQNMNPEISCYSESPHLNGLIQGVVTSSAKEINGMYGVREDRCMITPQRMNYESTYVHQPFQTQQQQGQVIWPTEEELSFAFKAIEDGVFTENEPQSSGVDKSSLNYRGDDDEDFQDDLMNILV